MKMNFKKLCEFMRNPDLKPIEKCVLLDLMLYAGKNGTPFPSQETLAKNHGRTPRYIRNCLERLKAKGLIKSWEKRGYSRSNIYILNEELYFRIDDIKRNYTSSQTGSAVPIQNGNEVPPNISKERNKLSNSSYVIQLYEKATGKRCHGTNRVKLEKLCNEYSEQWVIDAIRTASVRELDFIAVNYLELILSDWKKEGKPNVPGSKPIFIACNKNGCQSGYIDNSEKNVVVLCTCRSDYERKFEDWENEFRQWRYSEGR